MPPRPFPFPLRVGTDICSIARLHQILTPKPKSEVLPLQRFLPKLLTWPERQYFWGRFKSPDYAYQNLSSVTQFLAGRWAAKEACRKACEHLGSSNGFHSIMILPITPLTRKENKATSRPQGLILRERLPERTTDDSKSYQGDTVDLENFNTDTLDGQFCELSISHDTHWATAVAIVPVMEEWRDESKAGEQELD